MTKPSLIIIGAGASGLIAAKTLSPVFDITLLEAQPSTGGRIHSIQHKDTMIETGAEFVHGNLPVTLKLLQQANISYVKIAGGMYRKKNAGLSKVEEMTEGWDDLLEKMAAIDKDITMQELLDQYYSAAKYDPLRQHVRGYVQGFDLADLRTVSVKALLKEWAAEGEDNYRIPGGYSQLVQYLEQQVTVTGCKLELNCCVNKVSWERGIVNVLTSNGKSFTAGKLLVTIPVSLLKQPVDASSIYFDPALHFNTAEASDIGFGNVIKILIRFKKACWPKDAGFILSDEKFPTWWTQLPDETPLLTGWLGGPGAAAYETSTKQEIMDGALLSLSSIFNSTVETLKDNIEWQQIFNWKEHEFARGAYSYATTRTSAAIQLISHPLAHTIFFAGEALYEGAHPGTVEAAFVSGLNAAKKIMAAL